MSAAGYGPPGMGTVVNHVGLCVGDLERSPAVLRELLGFEVVAELEVPDDPTAKLLRLDPPVGLKAVYLQRTASGSSCSRTPTVRPRPARRAPDGRAGAHPPVDRGRGPPRRADRVAAYGGTVLRDSDIGVAAFVRDPDGQLIEVLRPFSPILTRGPADLTHV